MAIREQGTGKKKLDGEGLHVFFREIGQLHKPEEVTFLCIGTDRSTGDALGPLTGTRLAEYGFPHVIGTLPSPCDADNLTLRVAGIPEEHFVIAIDACLGPHAAVGYYFVSREPLHPARSVGLVLPAVGHYSLAAVVDVSGPKPYRTLQTTPLHRVMGMAGVIAAAAADGFGLLLR
ncbi:spore protease YyaC [Paenibacillus sp. HN-1]|uniref:spore protease YyaC n=1 Tax=Paenibacillus TaxID=44249 RepID=UPI001CA822BA|nr:MULTISPECIES: spore protease YyaC [Paenibacillus]MBY9077061.1 spore protease YyaC [Paenibacillus sp. CGMCC 1.18879]MBY9086566.1 spore protease YyaC [Paenibacillus sinensis]